MKQRKSRTKHFAVCIDNRGYPASLELHKIYRVVPDAAAAADGDIRVVDESGEDYLYPPDDFEPYNPNGDHDGASDAVTAHLTPYMKHILHAEAVAAHKTVSALLRDLISERFDLPDAA